MSTEGQGFVSIFEQNKGRVAATPLSNRSEPYIPFKLESYDNKVMYSNAKDQKVINGLVTELSISKAENVAMNATLGTDIYLYVGGETAHDITMSGLVFQPCEDEETAPAKGLVNILNAYYKNNVAHSGKACKITLANGLVYAAYLVAFDTKAVYKMDNTFEFSFKFFAVKKSS